MTMAATAIITEDTYVDSFVVEGVPLLDTTRTNYGNSAVVKAVSNNGSGSQYPLVTSLVRSLFSLPETTFWEVIGNNQVSSAVVSFQSRNNSLAGRNVLLHPLTQVFTEGTGGQPTASQGGTSNIPTPLGADWITYDGTNAWATPGGDFDAGVAITNSFRTVGVSPNQSLFLDWDITALLNDPALRAQIHAKGMLLRVTNETNYTGNEFISLRSSEATGNFAGAPFITFTIVPEPASFAGITSLCMTLFMRRNRRIQ
jgi:hypothetical protein